MQGTQVRSPVQEDPTCLRGTKPSAPQLLKPRCLEPVLHNKRSHCDEKLTHRHKEQPLLSATRETLYSNEDPAQPKINKNKPLKKFSCPIPGLPNTKLWGVQLSNQPSRWVWCMLKLKPLPGMPFLHSSYNILLLWLTHFLSFEVHSVNFLCNLYHVHPRWVCQSKKNVLVIQIQLRGRFSCFLILSSLHMFI